MVYADLHNPTDLQLHATALTLDIYHEGSGGSTLLASATLPSVVTVDGRTTGRLLADAVIQYSSVPALLSAGFDLASNDLVLNARNGRLTVGVGGAGFAITAEVEHDDLFGAVAAAGHQTSI